ncbi:hypothetical protein, partial [Acinetobacter sp. YH16057]|uniref:hypothetical protein n=1 Tax=Acinetobacter sp. YH16057 TaxID=2601195 RepID=UPI0015D302C2
VNIDINQTVEHLKDLLGKQVSYSICLGGTTYQSDGEVTSVVLHLHGDHEFSVDDGDYYSFSELTEFQVLDDRSIVDAAFTGLITDNKDFIDSLSKPTP